MKTPDPDPPTDPLGGNDDTDELMPTQQLTPTSMQRLYAQIEAVRTETPAPVVRPPPPEPSVAPASDLQVAVLAGIATFLVVFLVGTVLVVLLFR